MLPLRMLGLVMLKFLLCDADSTCPEELNPLILDPPEIIGEFGYQALVNCSSTFEYHEKMYWAEGSHNFDAEEESNFISHTVSMTDWNVRAECKIMLNETHECSKELEIIVYKNPEVVLSIKQANATQYELQCDIIRAAPVQNLTVTWYKNNHTITTSSFKDTTKTPVNESAVLAVDISRGENVVQFRCEAQLDFGPREQQLPVISETHNISAHYAPEFNTSHIEDIYVLEGNNITLNCEAEGNPPPVFQWTHDGMNVSEDTNTLNIARVNASATFTCTATNYLGNVTKQIHVYVAEMTTKAVPAAMPPTPEASKPRACPLTVTPSEIVVRFGDPASMNCSTSATNDSGMGWEAPAGGTSIQRPPLVTWMVEQLDIWDSDPYCYIFFNDGFQCFKTANITLYKTPDIVSVSTLDHGPMVEGTEYQLKCDIYNVAPVKKLKVKWLRGNETMHTKTFNEPRLIPLNVSSTLNVTAEKEHNGLGFRCEAELHLGPNGPEFLPPEASEPYLADVHYKPLITDCPAHKAVGEHKFSLDNLYCQADGNPPPTIEWYYQGELVNTSKPLNRADSGEYTAEVKNYLGNSSTSVHITVQYPPFFNCDERYEVEVNDELLTKCKPEGLPTPTLTWFKDGKPMVTPQHWTKNDNGEYLLKATNSHGTSEHRLHLDVLYAPEFSEGNYSKEVTPGENMTLTCSAEGNPDPVIQWNFTSAANPRETTVWRQKTITITRATSTSAGVYICVATNKVGSVTRSVTLAMKGKRQIPYAVIWGLLILLVILIILMLMVYFRNRKKKHGQYSFIPGRANSADIPLKPAGGSA